MSIFEKVPYFISNDGCKWWEDECINSYIKLREIKSIIGWFVEHKNGERYRVLVKYKNKIGTVIYEHTSLENVAVQIDLLSRLEKK